jgi:hypothetical protein
MHCCLSCLLSQFNKIEASLSSFNADRCDYPGAVCVWNVYAPSADDPEFVLDHTCCLTCVQCHPSMPALVAAGSFNGEVIVWDLTDPEKALALSPG